MDNLRRRILNKSGVDIDPTTGRGMIGDYEVVDLGLPSGLLWATCNVRATKETNYGKYYKWGSGAETYTSGGQYHTGGTDSSYTLPSSADTATQVMGEGWKMATLAEAQELIDNTNYEWVTNFNGSGKNGGKLTSKTNPNAYVFFPAAGAYYYYNNSNNNINYIADVWLSTAYNSREAYILLLFSSYAGKGNSRRYEYGMPVRGVYAAV